MVAVGRLDGHLICGVDAGPTTEAALIRANCRIARGQRRVLETIVEQLSPGTTSVPRASARDDSTGTQVGDRRVPYLPPIPLLIPSTSV